MNKPAVKGDIKMENKTNEHNKPGEHSQHVAKTKKLAAGNATSHKTGKRKSPEVHKFLFAFL